MATTRRRNLSLLTPLILVCIFSIFVALSLLLHWLATTTNNTDQFFPQTTTLSWQQQLRQGYSRRYPPDANRTRDFVDSIRRHHPKSISTTYDIYNCPQKPPSDYPTAWNVLTVLDNWNPDNATVPQQIYQGLCVFDYESDYDKALLYRHFELPFVVRNTPQLLETVERWNRDSYLEKLMANENDNKVEHSRNHHFMYWKLRHNQLPPNDWTPPTDIQSMSFSQWLSKAHRPNKDWYYFRFNAAYGSLHEFLYDELPFFREPSFFIVDPHQQRGINCRFGMEGVLAEAHYDSSRNFITVLGGSRRYILAHPRECQNLELHPIDHPSGRHSSVDWTSPKASGKFKEARVNEVLLQAGDALYLPTHWLHFIQSLDINYQCNARSGATSHYVKHVQACGFPH